MSAEINKLKQRLNKLEYGVTKKSEDIVQLKAAHEATLKMIATDSERVLQKQGDRIRKVEIRNALLEKKLCKKSKKCKKLRKMLIEESDSSTD